MRRARTFALGGHDIGRTSGCVHPLPDHERVESRIEYGCIRNAAVRRPYRPRARRSLTPARA